MCLDAFYDSSTVIKKQFALISPREIRKLQEPVFVCVSSFFNSAAQCAEAQAASYFVRILRLVLECSGQWLVARITIDIVHFLSLDLV